MNVKELIEKLTLEDPQKRVVVDGYESGFDEVDHLHNIKITPNINRKGSEKDDCWWEGEFELSSDEKGEEVILLPRKS